MWTIFRWFCKSFQLPHKWMILPTWALDNMPLFSFKFLLITFHPLQCFLIELWCNFGGIRDVKLLLQIAWLIFWIENVSIKFKFTCFNYAANCWKKFNILNLLLTWFICVESHMWLVKKKIRLLHDSDMSRLVCTLDCGLIPFFSAYYCRLWANPFFSAFWLSCIILCRHHSSFTMLSASTIWVLALHTTWFDI